MRTFLALGSLYPILSERQPLPGAYAPICFALSLAPFLTLRDKLAISLSLPVLFLLCICCPYYTFGDASSDYYNSSPFVAIPLWYIDFVLLTPKYGDDAVAFLGNPADETSVTQRWQDLDGMYQKLCWATRLMLPAHRGIGWNWQVKGVPHDPYARFPRWKYVAVHILWTLFFYIQSALMLVVLGYAAACRDQTDELDFWKIVALDALIGWSGAIWVWDRLSCAYSMAAALSVTIGLLDTWEWPPLMGSLKDAWSVRQMWSAVYHQTFRRLLSQPAMRITRGLGLRKGTLASKYMQLYLTFGISCLLHQFQMFNVTRCDMGEFAFFMSQPVAITVEDFMQWGWRKLRGSRRSGRFERAVGYAWVIVWFSLSLHVYIRGLVAAEVVEDWIFGAETMDLGKAFSPDILNGLQT